MPRLVGAGAPAAHEPTRVSGLGGLEHVDDARALGASVGAARVLDVDVRTLGKVANRVTKLEALALHDVIEHVTTGVAPEAIPKAGLGTHVKRRALLVVEGTAAPEVIATALAQHDRLAHELDDVGDLANALLVLLADHAILLRTKAVGTFV